jgi:centromeric protein E
MEGYHGTVFAYGMTGTGKTFSMQGTASSPGVIPLAITDIFSYIRETPSREFLLRVSYLEIYNEKIHDLLSAPVGGGTGPGAAQQEEIKLREDSKRGVYATPLKEEIVQSPTQLLRVIARGDNARRTSSTQFNSRSSRSHAVVQIVVESRERLPGSGAIGDNKRSAILPGGVRVSTLSLIDLAGSERAAETKERRTEGSHINKSLLTLGTVIARLSGDKDKDGKPTDKDGKHLPYRDSKLTRLLQGALSGDSLVSILCTIQLGTHNSTSAAANSHASETLNTLKFAARAKNNIVSHAKRAEEALGAGGDGGARVLLERYRMEIQDLRSQLDNQNKNKNKEFEEVDEKEREKEEARREEQMLEMQLARTALKERIEHLNRLILSSKSQGVNTSGSYSSLSMHPRLSGIATASHTSLSARSSFTPSLAPSDRRSLARTASIGSISTINQSRHPHMYTESTYAEEEDIGEFGDGTASLHAQNRALLSDLTDKNRYIATLEKRLLRARRSSTSRNSLPFSPTVQSGKGPVLFGEDSSAAQALREKDEEIRELRARLEDKDRMLSALRSATRNRDTAEATSSISTLDSRQSRSPRQSPPERIVISAAGSPRLMPKRDINAAISNESSLGLNTDVGVKDGLSGNIPNSPSYRASIQIDGGELSPALMGGFPKPPVSPGAKKRNKSVDEVGRLLEEMMLANAEVHVRKSRTSEQDVETH